MGPPLKPAPEATDVTVPLVSDAPVIVPATVRLPATATSPSPSTLSCEVPAVFWTSRSFVLAAGAVEGFTRSARPDRLNVTSPATVEA